MKLIKWCVCPISAENEIEQHTLGLVQGTVPAEATFS